MVPIIQAGIGSRGNSSIEASSFWLKLNNPVAYNDTLTLVTRIGNDLNTLINSCGNELRAGDSVRVIANACSTWISQEERQLTPFQLYPNPVSGEMNITLPESIQNVHIQITNLTGKLILDKQIIGKSEINLNLDSLPPGFYLLEVQSDNWAEVSKFEKL